MRWALTQLSPRFSRRSLQITRNCFERTIKLAQANDLVGRNVASLVSLPEGRSGRRSKSFTVEQAKALLAAARGRRLDGYIILSLLTGLRTEEVRAAEGVPRDAINIAAKAGFRAGSRKIAISDVRWAARSWLQADKKAALQSRRTLSVSCTGHRQGDQAEKSPWLSGKPKVVPRPSTSVSIR